jgi:hypothetical protein
MAYKKASNTITVVRKGPLQAFVNILQTSGIDIRFVVMDIGGQGTLPGYPIPESLISKLTETR